MKKDTNEKKDQLKTNKLSITQKNPGQIGHNLYRRFHLVV